MEATTYQLYWSGRSSNVWTGACSALCLAVTGWCMWYVVRQIRGLRIQQGEKAVWDSALRTLAQMLGVLAVSVVAGVSGRSAFGSGYTAGYSANMKPRPGFGLAIAMFAIPIVGRAACHEHVIGKPTRDFSDGNAGDGSLSLAMA